jgi:DNA-binding transcriptional MerR regulator
MAPTDYSISDVSALTETPVRTIRYYIAQGLLPSSRRVGPAARYDDAFVARLRAIRRLQDRHLPLAEIRRTLEGMPDATVIAAVEPEEVPPSDSAAEYVRRLLGVAEERVSYAAVPPPAPFVAPGATSSVAAPTAASVPPPAAALQAAVPARLDEASRPGVAGEPRLFASARFTPPDADVRSLAAPGVGWGDASTMEPREPAMAERSHWERIAVTPEIEIHIRRPLSRRSAKRAERLVEFARDIFEEGA